MDSLKGSNGTLQRLVYGRNKTVDGVNTQAVASAILAKSGESQFMKRMQDRSQRTIERIKTLCLKWERATHEQRISSQKKARIEMNVVQQNLRYDRVFVHCDLDAFYAAVEERDNPELKGKPMAVGGMKMLTTANYEARKHGVRSAMPGYIAKELYVLL